VCELHYVGRRDSNVLSMHGLRSKVIKSETHNKNNKHCCEVAGCLFSRYGSRDSGLSFGVEKSDVLTKMSLRVFRTRQRCGWGIISSMVRHRITGWLVSNISRQDTGLIFEGLTSILPRNVGNQSPSNAATYCRRTDTSRHYFITPTWCTQL